jgi:hypothetical protein
MDAEMKMMVGKLHWCEEDDKDRKKRHTFGEMVCGDDGKGKGQSRWRE